MRRKEQFMKIAKRFVVFVLIAAIFCAFGITANAAEASVDATCSRPDLHISPYGLYHQKSGRMDNHGDVVVREIENYNNILTTLYKGDSFYVIWANTLYYNGRDWSHISANGYAGLTASEYLH